MWKCELTKVIQDFTEKCLGVFNMQIYSDFPRKEIEFSFLNSFGPRVWFMQILTLPCFPPPISNILLETIMMGEELTLHFISLVQALWLNYLDGWVTCNGVDRATHPSQIRTDVEAQRKHHILPLLDVNWCWWVCGSGQCLRGGAATNGAQHLGSQPTGTSPTSPVLPMCTQLHISPASEVTGHFPG